MKLIKINTDHYELDGIKVTDRLSEVKELLGEVDVEKKAREEILYNDSKRDWWKQGYNQALDDNKEKKYTEEDLRKAYLSNGPIGDNDKGFNALIQSLQPKTEWDVYFDENGKLKLV